MQCCPHCLLGVMIELDEFKTAEKLRSAFCNQEHFNNHNTVLIHLPTFHDMLTASRERNIVSKSLNVIRSQKLRNKISHTYNNFPFSSLKIISIHMLREW